MSACPHCCGTGVSPEAQASVNGDQLRDVCRERGIWISPDGKVREDDAATLVGWQIKTMRNRRYADEPIPSIRRGNRVLYAITDLAEWMQNN